MPNTLSSGATKTIGNKTVPSELILTERLRILAIQPGGLPPHVLGYLRSLVEDEAIHIQRDLARDVAALQQRAEARLSKQVARLITLKSVGKAFGATSTKADSSASTATGGAAS